jgi:hypothetical protein
MVPMQARKMRLHRARLADSQWLATILDQISRPYGSLIGLEPGGTLTLRTSWWIWADRHEMRGLRPPLPA